MGTEGPDLTIGLVPEGGTAWIAGVIYLENIVRAVRALGEARLELCFVADADHQFGRGSRLTVDVPTYFYTHRSHRPWEAAWNSVKARRAPQSLEALARRIGLSVLFPLQAPPRDALPVPWIGWIPDFQHKRRPEFFSVEQQAERDGRFQRIVDEASHIVVSSHDARADLMRWFPTSDARISVLQFRSALDPRWFDPNPRTVAAQLDLPLKYLTYPSQLWAHKNHHTVFAALGMLRARGRTDIVLACTGHEYDDRRPKYVEGLKEEIVRLGIQSQVRVLGLLDRQAQIQVMRASAAVVQASFFEGWSALIEDSRALGKRMFVSDIPVHREQNPQDAAYFSPDSSEELADLIDAAWPHLAPGPDLDREHRARDEQGMLIRDFACCFVDIVGRARGAASRRP